LLQQVFHFPPHRAQLRLVVPEKHEIIHLAEIQRGP
jgi:hypothetical protein